MNDKLDHTIEKCTYCKKIFNIKDMRKAVYTDEKSLQIDFVCMDCYENNND